MSETEGAIYSTKISGNFGPKLNGSVRSNRKSFEKTGPPFEVDQFSRSDRLEFWLNGSRPELQLCNFFSQDATFTKVYNSTPHVFVSANHSSKNGSQSPIHNSIAEWVEVCFLFIYLFVYFFIYSMNFCNIPLATTLTCVVCMFKNLMNDGN